MLELVRLLMCFDHTGRRLPTPFILYQRNPAMSSAKPNRLDAKLLADLQRFFAAQTAKHIPTEQLLAYLAGIDNAPWATLAQGKPITARHLAHLLRPYGIKPKNLWQSGSVAKGYTVADLLTHSGIADNLADSGIADNLADSGIADKSDDVAANVADRKPPVADNVVDMATRKPPVASHSPPVAVLVDKIDVTDRKPVVAAISDDVADLSVADKSDDVAANVVTITRTAVTITDHLAPPVPAKPARKWPPPKGWAFNYRTKCYEPPKPKVQTDPPDQAMIRQTLHVSPHLQYVPGYGLMPIDPNLPISDG